MKDYWRHWRHRHRCGHPKGAAAIVLIMSSVQINLEEKTVKVTLVWSTPAFRADGTTPLALTDIKATNIMRNGAVLAQVAAVDPSQALGNSYVDTSPLTGADTYVIDTITNDGFSSADSNPAVVNIVAANPAAAITDLSATLTNDDGSPVGGASSPAPAAKAAKS